MDAGRETLKRGLALFIPRKSISFGASRGWAGQKTASVSVAEGQAHVGPLYPLVPGPKAKPSPRFYQLERKELRLGRFGV